MGILKMITYVKNFIKILIILKMFYFISLYYISNDITTYLNDLNSNQTRSVCYII